jgi:hypothetical protein
MHPTLRVALHFKRTVITALSLAVAVGVFIGWLLFRTPTPALNSAANGSTQQPPHFCDAAHIIPYVPAEQCGGISSCDRARMNNGNIAFCPRE